MLVSLCLQPFLCMWPQGSFFFFFFILPTSKLGKVQLGNTFESKNELCLLQSFFFSGLRQYVLFWGWVAEAWETDCVQDW